MRKQQDVYVKTDSGKLRLELHQPKRTIDNNKDGIFDVPPTEVAMSFRTTPSVIRDTPITEAQRMEMAYVQGEG